MHIYIYIYINTELLDENKGHEEETHYPTHRFRRLFLDLLSMGWRGCASAMGAIEPRYTAMKKASAKHLDQIVRNNPGRLPIVLMSAKPLKDIISCDV